jgi:hypothetical protein
MNTPCRLNSEIFKVKTNIPYNKKIRAIELITVNRRYPAIDVRSMARSPALRRDSRDRILQTARLKAGDEYRQKRLEERDFGSYQHFFHEG